MNVPTINPTPVTQFENRSGHIAVEAKAGRVSVHYDVLFSRQEVEELMSELREATQIAGLR